MKESENINLSPLKEGMLGDSFAKGSHATVYEVKEIQEKVSKFVVKIGFVA